MTITYYIDNATPNLVKTVMLRKFFQMVFIGNDRKSLHIYTASVIGGCNKEQSKEKQKNFYSTRYVSRLDKLKAFRMKFEFVVRGNDNNDVLSIKSENITNGDQGFLSQVEYIRQVWGDECKVIQDNQKELDQTLAKYLPSEVDPDRKKASIEDSADGCDTAEDGGMSRLKNWGIESSQTALLAGQKILYLGDEKKKREEEMFGLALAGEFQQKSYDRPAEPEQRGKVLEGSERAFYCIQVPQDMELVPGIELVNWVKTTICFHHRFHDSNLNFCIQKKDKSETEVQYIAPDFTWYFSPPIKAFINNESSSVELKIIKDTMDTAKDCQYHSIPAENEDSDCKLLDCTCPIRKMGILDHTTTRYPNVINPVANKTTVNFKQWTNDEMIGYRQKYRLAVKNIFSQNITIDDASEINIFLDTTDEHGRGNRQFVLGLFISFALAFGIDSTRLDEAAPYFPFPTILEAGAWWLLLLILLSLNILIRPPHTEREHWYYVWRRTNIITTLIWVVCVFIVFKSQLLLTVCIQWQSSLENVMQWLYFIPFGLNFCYIFWNITKYKDPILSSLFSDDIL